MATELFAAGSSRVLYIVDLSSYMLRAYHAIAPLSSPTGEPTHAVHGCVNMLERLIRLQRPALIAAALDSGRATFRREIFAEYKAHRPAAPDDLRSQLARCEEIVCHLGIATFKQEGVEADDLIASLVKLARQNGLQVVIVGADKDLMQLVSADVILWDTMRDRVFGVEEVEARFGVSVAQLRDLLALVGDTSDNIPGVPSVGPKTACELLTQYGTLSSVYEHLEDISKKKLKETLRTHREQAFLSQRLVTLRDDCAIELDFDRLKGSARDLGELRRIYSELGFTRQLERLALLATPLEGEPKAADASAAPAIAQAAPVAIQTLLTEPVLAELLETAQRSQRLAVWVQANTDAISDHSLIGLGLCAEENTGYYLPLGHRYIGVPNQLEPSKVARLLAPVLADARIKKLGHDLKHVAVVLAQHDLKLSGLAFDAMLAAYLLDPESAKDMNTLSQQHLGLELSAYDAITKEARRRVGFDAVNLDLATDFVAKRAAALFRLEPIMLDRLQAEGLSELYEKLELPLISVLVSMEQRGVLVDIEVLKELGKSCNEQLHVLEAKAQEVAGRAFNVHSPRQLEAILFDELALKPLKRTKTSRSTDAATLEALSLEHELPKIILDIRQLAKLKSTYIEALPSLVNKATGRIHSCWQQAVAATGRLSSTEPNLQNIPIRTKLGQKVRAAFVAPAGHQLVSADYSQIELRVLAHLSQDPVLLEAFRTGQDIHTRTAMEIFEVAQEQVTREMRTRAKAVNFGIIYGQGDSGLAKVLGISKTEAANFIAAYFRRYQGVQRFMNDTLEAARAGESVRSLLGRHRRLPDIRSGNRARRLAAERIAMNMPIQATAADILKLAMLALEKPVTDGTRMVLTVHDELVFEVPGAEVERAEVRIRDVMQSVHPLAVPLVVDVSHGRNWYEAH